MFWLLGCPLSIVSALISFSEFCGINAEYLWKVRMLCGLCQECSKLVKFVGCSKGRTRSSATIPGVVTPTAPAGRPGTPLKIYLDLYNLSLEALD